VLVSFFVCRLQQVAADLPVFFLRLMAWFRSAEHRADNVLEVKVNGMVGLS
jgi:hypothetical protein